MVDVLNYLQNTKNALIGNPMAKVELNRSSEPDSSTLLTIVEYLNYAPEATREGEVVTRIRIEAANVITSLANGPKEVLYNLLEVNTVTAVVSAIEQLRSNDPERLKVALLRALRSLSVAFADCAGTSLWGLTEERLECVSKARAELDYVFSSQQRTYDIATHEETSGLYATPLPAPIDVPLYGLDFILPLIEDSSSQVKLAIAQLLAFATRLPQHSLAVTEWLPPEERWKQDKSKRGWEKSALVKADAPSRLGGWVVRHLSEMLSSREFRLKEAALYAIAALVKGNKDIADILHKPPPDEKGIKVQCVLNTVATLTKDRRAEIQLAACLCAASILRELPASHHVHSTNYTEQHQLSNLIIHVLSSIFAHPYDTLENRTRACHILSFLVTDDESRCKEAVNAGALTKLSDVIKNITPTAIPQEWEDGEATDVARLREAALTAVATLSLSEENIRDDVTRSLRLLPVITVCLKHPQARVRYGACLCIRSLSRSVRVLRTSVLDSGAGLALVDLVRKKDEDRRVLNMALSGLCNLLNDCSPLRKPLLDMDGGIVIKRIEELSRDSQPDSMRTNAVWALRNLLHKASVAEKKKVMGLFGWSNLKGLLADHNIEIEEQAFSCTVNITANSQDHIELLFEHFSESELMDRLECVLQSNSTAKAAVRKQVIFLLSNISNGNDEYKIAIRSSAVIVRELRKIVDPEDSKSMESNDLRLAAITCLEAIGNLGLSRSSLR